jgi:aspartyl-tRNA(Asn)/glutamyl-tRNA(Gln) amidotransferase subunit A|tara:strand:- start:232 stop:1653 length:1422 start_codon:yes stop_codon:yes gene_type:complete
VEILGLSGTAIAKLIKNGEVSAVDVMEQALNQADKVQAHLNPFVTITREAALAQAKQADELLKRTRPETLPAFFGVPFTVKDLLDTQGVQTTYGSRSLEHNIPDSDVVAVARMRAAGAILLGKTTTPEFASKVTTDAVLTGITRNPWAPSLSCGGSSGGDGVAVATGTVPFGVSTDGGGSSRIPAAVCGVLGMKVTIGAIPHESWPFHFGNNSSISMNCRHPEDLVTLFNTMSGAHHLDPWSRREIKTMSPLVDPARAVQGKRALFIPALGGNIADAQYQAIVEKGLAKLGDLGLDIDVALDDPTEFQPGIATQMMTSNLAARVRQMPVEAQQLLGPVLQSLLEEETFKSDGVRLQSDAIDRSRTYDRLERVLSQYDFVLTPTLTAPPPLADPNGDQRVTINGNKERVNKWWTHLCIANLTGHPAISIPCGIDTNDLPVGLHAIGGWDRDSDLVSLAFASIACFDWTERRPVY